MSYSIPAWAISKVLPHVLSIPEYIPGKPIAEVERELGISGAIKLASNENPLGPSPKAVDAIVRNLGMANIYPESSAPELRRALASRYDLEPDNFALGNGSDEIMQMLSHVFVSVEDEVVMPENAFSMYKIVTRLFGGKSVLVPLKNFRPDISATIRALNSRTRLVFVSNPHSPTGSIIGRSEFEELLSETKKANALLVVDEAYYEYVDAEECPTGFDYLSRYDNLIILRTFSKIYGLAGMRIGYGSAHTWLIQLLNKVRAPFNVNLLAQEAARAALEDDDHIRKSRQLNSSEKRFLNERLTAMGFEPIPSQANFIAFKPNLDAGQVYASLLREGVIVRHLKSFGLPDHIRVTVGLEEQNIKFIDALMKVTQGSRAIS
jgi:histidinol-phosphate aminotransferase